MTATHYHRLPTYAWAGPDNTYLKKIEFLKRHLMPGIDEVKLNIGCQLADIFLTRTGDCIRDCMGVEKKLEGPKEQMWLSPADQLMGKMVLTEPFPRQQIQAMTHQNILEIGEMLEAKYKKIKIEELELKLKQAEQNVRNEMEKEFQKRVDEVRIKMEDMYRNRLQYAKQQLTLKFQEIMVEQEKAMYKKSEQKVLDALSFLRKSMAEEMEVIARRRQDYNVEVNSFQRIWDANKAYEVFKKKINNNEKKWIKILKRAERKSENEKKVFQNDFMQYHEVEIKKAQESSYSEFQNTLQTMTKNYRRTISDLLKTIKKKGKEYEKLKMEKECAHIEQYSWCYLVRELLKQFQKFINYVLDQKPGHAEYLLSLEKLLNTRVESLTKVGFLRKYIDEKGSNLINERLTLEEAKLRMQPLKEVELEEKAKPEYPCLREDIFKPKKENNDNWDVRKKVKEIENILDQMINRAVPRLTELPCIDSELWTSVKSSSDHVAYPADSQPPGLRFCEGDDKIGLSKSKFAEDRVKSLMRILNRHPGIKLAIIGNS